MRQLRRAALIMGLLTVLGAALSQAATVTQALAVTASTSNATSYATASFTPAAGDLLVVMVSASGTVDAGSITDTQSLGWTKIASTTYVAGSTMYLFVSNTTAAASTETITFNCSGDSATGAVIDVERIASMPSGRTGALAVRQFIPKANQTSGGTPAVTFTFATLTGNPTLLFVGNSTNPATLTAPTNWTEQGDSGYGTPTSGAEFVKRDSGFASQTVTWGSTSGSGFGIIGVELDTSTAPGSNVPAIHGNVWRGPNSSLATEFNGNASSLEAFLPNTTDSGSCVLVIGTWGAGSASNESLTDNNSGVYTKAFSSPPGNANQIWQAWVGQPASGSGKYNVSFGSGTASFAEFAVIEIDHTNCVFDGVASGSGTSTSVTTSAIVTSQANSLVIQCADQDTTGQNTTWTKGTGWTPISFDNRAAFACQYKLQASAGSITPTITQGSSQSFATIAVALKASTDGSTVSSSTARILKSEMQLVVGGDSSPIAVQASSVGTTTLIGWIGAGTSDTVTSISDNFVGGSWSKAASDAGKTISSPEIWCTHGSAGGGTITLTTASPSASESIGVYDAQAVNSCTPHATNSADGNQSGGFSSPISAGSIMTSAANKLIVGVMGVEFNGVRTVSPGRFAPQDNNNGFLTQFTTSSGTQSYSWTTDQSGQAGGIGRWNFTAAAFDQAGGAQVGNVSDTLTSSPTLAISVGRQAALSQTVTLSPGVTAILAANAGLSDTLTGSPSITATVGKGAAVNDSLTGSPSVTAVLTANVTISQTVTLSPSVTAGAGRFGNPADSVTFTPGITALAGQGRSISDSATLAPSLSTQTGFARSAADSVTLAPALTATKVTSTSLSSTVTLTPAVAALAGQGRSVSDSLTASPSLTIQATFARQIAEVVTVSPGVSAVKSGGGTAGLADSLTLSAAVAGRADHFSNVSETLNASPQLSAAVLRTVVINETTTLTAQVGVSVIRFGIRRRFVIMESN